jgi:uncharacterized membrane protein YfcA
VPVDLTIETLSRFAGVGLAAAAGSMINSVAGGGTLLTFPMLVALGVPPLVANATSTVALWPGNLGSMYGYRSRIRGMGRWAVWFAVPSLVGGAIGAVLLLRTSPDRFDAIVPWLVFGATGVFAIQRPLTHALARGRLPTNGRSERPVAGAFAPHAPSHSVIALVCQFGVAIYGGYFGAGIGILMLAVLGFMGFTDIHQMNGLKNWGGLCVNFIAAGLFVASDIVDWPVAITMAAGALLGGYSTSRLAQRLPPRVVRRFVLVVGVCSGMWLLA